MRNKKTTGINRDAPFQTIENAATITGLSQCYLRSGCRNGTVPHEMCGKKFMVNIPALLRQLGADEEVHS